MLRGVVDRPVITVDLVGAAVHNDQFEVPSGEDPRRCIHIGFGKLTHPDGEQLHQFAAEVLLGARAGVGSPVKPDEHRRVFGNLDQQVTEAARGPVAEQLNLSARAVGLRVLIHHLGRMDGAVGAGDLRIGRGKEVVPEQRHLLLQRTTGVHHPEQPPLARIVDDRIGREGATHRDACMGRMPDQRIGAVRSLGIVQQFIDELRRREVGKVRKVIGTRPESHPAEDMLVHAAVSRGNTTGISGRFLGKDQPPGGGGAP